MALLMPTEMGSSFPAKFFENIEVTIGLKLGLH
jgi:hypothetical protein